ncbi:MAG: ZIP family metal transporter [Candidatus Woesearchaeota archaeon]
MHEIWFYTLISVIIVSLISLIGLFTFSLRQEFLKKILLFLVSFAAGALLGDSFIHLIPEIVESYGFTFQVSLMFLIGILLFFTLEKFICWRHCHIPTSKQHPHHLGVMNLVGDGFHNFLDGVLIAGSYIANTQIGIATTVAVLLHEIPQEIGDFGILLHAGYSKKKALFFNFLSACISIIGAILTLIIGKNIENITLFLIPIAAGGFIYIASSDLIPELHKETSPAKSGFQLFGILLGIGIMAFLLLIEG